MNDDLKKIEELKTILLELVERAKFFNNHKADCGWFCEYILKGIHEEQKTITRQIKFLRKPVSARKNDVPMEMIRQYPILDLLPIGTTKRKMSATETLILCPAHNDTNPSCSINTEKNIWNCLSCNEGGTNIGYVMAAYSLNKAEAVRKIKNLIT